MKIASIILTILGICFCILGFMGHFSAWVAAAMCFFAVTMITVNKQNKNNKK